MEQESITRAETLSAADVLRRAKARCAAPEQWRKDGGDCSDGKYCVAQAIYKPEHSSAFSRGTMAALIYFARAIGVSPDDEGVLDLREVFHWNDAPERTHAECMGALDRSIGFADAEGV